VNDDGGAAFAFRDFRPALRRQRLANIVGGASIEQWIAR